MSQRHTFSMLATLLSTWGLFSVGLAYAQQDPPVQPSTNPAEGTAADRTKPGETPTRSQAEQQQMEQQQDPRPSTSETEGTAADRTAPGQTPTMQSQAKERGAQRSEMVGKTVVTSANAPVGEVVDVVFEAADQPAFVVIASEGTSVAVPYTVASSMRKGDKIVVDRERLKGAPKVSESELRDDMRSERWKTASSKYWERG